MTTQSLCGKVLDNHNPYTIYLPRLKSKCEVFYSEKLNLHKGDIIVGLVEPMEVNFKLVEKPLLILGRDIDNIKGYMSEALSRIIKKDSTRSNKMNALYNFFLHDCVQNKKDQNKLGSYIDERLKKLAQTYKNHYTAGVLEGLLSPIEISNLLRWWFKNRIMRLLEHYNITYRVMRTIGSKTPLDICRQIRVNPYVYPQLSIELVNTIARCNGLVFPEDEIKIAEILRFVWDKTVNAGWTYYPLEEIKNLYPFFSKYPPEVIDRYNLYVDDDRLYVKSTFDKENFIAHYITDQHMMKHLLDREKIDVFIETIKEERYLSQDQIAAVNLILTKRVSIVTGPAGSGKTSLLERLVPFILEQGKECIFVSFTGKAVSRLRSKLKRLVPDEDHISTIHHYMNKFGRSLKPHYIFVDETSMVGLDLFYSFCSLFEHHHHICFIGDHYQLPPIGEPDLFTELVFSNLPRFDLTTVHRVNNKELGIYSNAQHIRSFPFYGSKPSDVIIKETMDFNLKIGDMRTIEEIVNVLMKGGIDDDQMVILSPFNMYLKELNDIFRRKNPHPSFIDTIDRKTGHLEWKVGDRVMLTENCYEIGVMNGEEGKITEHDVFKQEIKVDFGCNRINIFTLFDRKTPYDEYSDNKDSISKENLSTRFLLPSYAQTIHKSQGSEWNVVFLYLPDRNSSGTFINRSLLYTAITRAKKLLFIVGSPKIFRTGICIPQMPKFNHLGERINNLIA